VSCYHCDILANLLERPIIILVHQMYKGNMIKISSAIHFPSLLEYFLCNLYSITCDEERNLFCYELKGELMEISLDHSFNHH